MSIMKTKLTEAINAKTNDITSYVWKLSKQSDGTQPEIKLIDASDDQLRTFYEHCLSMLYSNDKVNPGRYTLLKIIQDQWEKCNAELYLKKLHTGEIVPDHKSYPRFLYFRDLKVFLDRNREAIPPEKYNEYSISLCTGGIPREFERLSISTVIDACLDTLGIFDSKHITFSFILNLGIHLTPEELKEFNEKDANGNKKSKLTQIKERLGISEDVRIDVKPGGLTFHEFRSMLNLKTKKYSELTTDQLETLRNKVLYRLEQKVKQHITSWEERINQIKKVAASRGLNLD